VTALGTLAWRHPQWWALAVSGAAWTWLVVRPEAGPHAHADGGAAAALAGWAAMVGAMMLPLVTPHLHFAARRSLWRRRHRAMAGVLAGYVAVWMAAGTLGTLAARPLGMLIPWVTGEGGRLLLLALALGWHLAPARRRAVAACHLERPLAPSGWRATRDCVGYGVAVGRRCVVACGGLMVACAALGHGLTPMAMATGVALYERRRPFGR
jgi:hypothetical protein